MHPAHQGNGGFGNFKKRGETGRFIVYLLWVIMVMSVLGSAGESCAADQPLFGPKTYSRSQGKPATITDTFSGCSSGNSGVLRLINGADKDSRVSSVRILLNGARVIEEHDLNKNVTSLERLIALKSGANTLSVTVKSGDGEGDDDDRHDDKDSHHDKDFDSKANKNGKEDERRSSGGDSDKGGKGEHHDDHHHGKGDGEDRHHEGDDEHGRQDDDDHRHAPVLLTVEILGRGCDALPPAISAPQPSEGALLAFVRPAISAAFTDNSGGSGVDAASVRVTLDGSDITTACSITATGVACTLTNDLADGTHSVTVAVADLAKNPASYSWRFTTDITPPKVMVNSPQSGQSLGNPVVTVSGSIDDSTATVTVNGIAATISGANFSASGVQLTEGVNTITATAVDPVGNSSMTSVSITLDTSLPVVTITAPIEGSFTAIPVVTVSGSVSEAASAVTINGKSATLTGNSFTLENLPLAEGQNSITILAQDLAGNKGSAVATVTLDTVNPQIFVTTPADGLLTRNPQLTVSGTVSEPLTSLIINGQTVQVDGLAFTTTLALNEGANSIVLSATDRAGNKGSASITVTLDSTPPTVPVLEALTSPTNNPIVTVKGSAEPGSSVDLSAGGVQIANSTADTVGLISFSNITLTEGETRFTAQATDSAGNAGQSSAPLEVILDTVAPSVAISAPLDGTNLNTPIITVSGSIDDSAALVTVNGLLATNSGGICTLDGLTLQEGNNTLLVEARDPAGNKGSTSATVVLDTIPPVVAIAAPVDGLYTNITQVTVTGTVNEAVVSVTVNGTSATLSAGSTPAASTTFTATLTLTEGANSIVIAAVDKAGNTGTATVSVTLDTIAPQLTVIGPADGALLNNGQITFGGSAAEPVVSVLVNGIAAQAGSNGGYTLPVTLVEGSNSLTVTAIDRAGNRSTSTISVNLDSIAPAAPLLDPLATPTRTAMATVSGQAEALATVKLFNNDVLITTLTADAAGLFSVANITLTEGNNPFTTQATDAAGNTSPLSAPLTMVLDTKAPVITVTAPQPGVVVSAAQVTIIGTVDEPLASLTVNGASVPLSNLSFEYVTTLAAGDNSALITATDLAGNIATTTITIKRDSTPPKVVIVAPLPGLLTNNPQVQVSGTVDDADAALTVAGAPVSVANKSFSVGYVLSDGDNSIQVKAVDKAGNEGTATVTVTLDAQPPVVSLNAPATATAGTDVQISVNATDNRGLTLVDVSADGASLWSAAPNSDTASQTVSLRLSPTLTPGATVTVRGRALDAAGNSGSSTTVITIDKGADGPGWLQGKVLDDNRGLPLAGAQVSVTDAKGVQQSVTTPADGAWFFELASGAANVEVTQSGFTAVRRDVTVRPGQRTSVLDSRLTKLDGTVHTVDAAGGVIKSTPFKIQNSSFTIDVQIPAAALSVQTDVRLTPVSNQGLIAPLPLGWSPLAAADLRLLDPVTATPIDPQPLTAPATLALPLPAGLGDSALTAQLARYNNSSRRWLAVAEVAVAAKATSAAAQITQPGQYALVLADPAPLNPPAPATGQELAAVTLQPSDFSLISTTGRVVPQAAPPSVGLRAAGDLLLVAKPDAATAPALISGLVVNARVTEKFDLTGGSTLQPAATVQDIVLYRTPCATSIAGGATEPLDSAVGLRTTFPVSPSKEFTIVDLLLGKIRIDITQPDTSGGVMVGADGARLLQPDGTSLSIPAGALTGTVPVTVTTLPEASVSALIGADFRLLRGVDIAITGQTLKNSATLSIPAPEGFNAALPVVVARKFDVKGGSKLKLVAMGRLSGSIINSELLGAEIWAGAPRPYIDSSGQYLFLQAVAPIGYVAGQITDAAAAAFAGIQVTAQSATLADLTGVNGQYLLALAAGTQAVTALDPARGDAASGTVAIAASSKSILNLTVRMTPPTVVSISPANGAINVQPDVPVTVIFSKQMDRTSITNSSFVVRATANSVIPGVLTFNVDNTSVSFYPTEAFKQEITYSVTISATVKDLQGYPLGQDVVSTFTIRKTTPPPMPPAGNVNATFPDADGFITITGTQGTAPADCTVLLINDTSGEIVSVTPATNGSFTGKVRGQLGDQIKVVIMDKSGNQTLVSYLTFKSDDGSYLVTSKGGKVEGEGGSILEIPEGALSGPTIVKLTFVPEAGLASPVPAPGTYLSAFNIGTGGIDFLKEVHLSMPLPDGFDPATPVFVNRPSEIYNADGTIETVYEIIDSTKVINNRLTTASPPFTGIVQVGSYAFISFGGMKKGIVSGYTYQKMNDQTGYQPLPKGVIDPTFDADGSNPIYKYDRPIKGAVIRTPDAWNYVSYSNDSGFYAGFATLYAYVVAMQLDYRITAIHPLTMRRLSHTLFMDVDHDLITNLNFMLADKNSIPPDKTPPVIDLAMQAASGQAPTNRISSGTMPLATELQFSLTISDQSSVNPTLTVEYKSPEATAWQQYSAPLTRMGTVLSSAPTADKPAIWRYTFKAVFPAELQGSQDSNCKPGLAGNYRFTVEAIDTSANKSTKTLPLRVVAVGAIPGGVDGAPTLDNIAPADGAKDLPVTTQITVWFSEPVENVTPATFKLIDTSNGRSMPAIITTSYEGGRMQAVLTPRGNLSYDRQYQVQVLALAAGGITDINTNPSADNTFLPLAQEYRSTFTTKRPSAYDLAEAEQFDGARDIALYNHYDGKNYAYIAAGDQGWYVVDISEPSNPTVVNNETMSSLSVNWGYRGVAVHPEGTAGIMAMTDNIAFNSGNQYGYVRFYDIKTDPVKPEIIGKQRLAEAYSGIPGRLALSGDYAYVATSSAALQVVSISKAIDSYSGFSADDPSIVGVFDSIGLGYGSPNDITVYGTGKALLTTNPGYLITLDINNPTPVLMGVVEPKNLNALRVAGVSDFSYADADGNPQIMDLALTGGGGKLKTVDLTDPYNPKVLATVKDALDKEVVSYPYDITLNKETGLAIVSSLSAIQVVDVKDPKNPRLINTFTQLPNGNAPTTPTGAPVQLPIGVIPAMVEQDGWVYMANDKQGLKVVQFITRTIDILRINPIEIDDTGHSINDAVITYRVNNKDYEIHSGEVNIYKNGVRILTLPSGTGHTASVTIPKGQAFDANSKYEAVVVINKMSADVLTSYKARISVFNVKPVIDSVTDVIIDLDGFSQNDLKVNYTINPMGYQATNANVILVENGIEIKSASVPTSGTGSAVFAKGMKLDISKKYEVYVMINYNLSNAKESERKEVTVNFISSCKVKVGGILVNIPDGNRSTDGGSCCYQGSLQQYFPIIDLGTCPNRVQNLSWKTEYDGCTNVPNNPTIVTGAPFSNADRTGVCDEHDQCYQKCSKNIYEGRLACDEQFLQNALKVCEKLSDGPIKNDCVNWANVYHDGLRLFGSSAYNTRQMQTCDCCN